LNQAEEPKEYNVDSVKMSEKLPEPKGIIEDNMEIDRRAIL
jgi:hypothetical protein